MINASAAFHKLSTSHLYHISVPVGELGDFRLFFGMLTTSFVFAVVFMPIQMLGASLHIPDMSMMFPSVTGPSVPHNLVHPSGEYGTFESFLGFLASAGIFELIAPPFTCIQCVRLASEPHWLAYAQLGILRCLQLFSSLLHHHALACACLVCLHGSRVRPTGLHAGALYSQ